ncbi:PREDICTED: probable RNA-binding protein CG14230, partial [Eufriesea mexicana]|uniref:probable RNA-binding protein CG14230 n=1 Tax=Eufriesea mexicana TaxID=516756 RepID=UPI00083C287B
MVILEHEINEEIKMDKTDASEKKRLESLKHKKQIFKARELAVQNALKNLDSKSNNNKIIFDDNIDKIEQSKVKKKEKKRKRDLFDDDDDDVDNKNDAESVWDASKFKINKSKSGKLVEHITLGNDERFKLDERFMEDDQNSDKNITIENSNETDLQKEKELQLDILENILGVPIISKNKDSSKDVKPVKKGMIRYDPTEDGHKEYEINTEKSEPEAKKVKKKKKNKDNTEDVNQNPPVEVSKDIYFSVSNSLSQRLKDGGEEFSLLKTYGKEINDAKTNDNNDISTTELLKPSKIQLGIDSKNPFKYDSSDDEYDNNYEYTNNEQHTNEVVGHINKFFFDTNDIRFNEAKEFFSKEPISEDAFKGLRHELKQIVRAKVLSNRKKKQPWGYKKRI